MYLNGCSGDSGLGAGESLSPNAMAFDTDSVSWSEWIARTYGRCAAVAFYLGSEILLDVLDGALRGLFSRGKGSHLGELEDCYLACELPQQFLMAYDYDFVYKLRARLYTLCRRLHKMTDGPYNVHSVADELLLHLCLLEAEPLMEFWEPEEDDFKLLPYGPGSWEDYSSGLMESMNEDLDCLVLYSSIYLSPSHPYHFQHWFDHQFHENDVDPWDYDPL